MRKRTVTHASLHLPDAKKDRSLGDRISIQETSKCTFIRSLPSSQIRHYTSGRCKQKGSQGLLKTLHWQHDFGTEGRRLPNGDPLRSACPQRARTKGPRLGSQAAPSGQRARRPRGAPHRPPASLCGAPSPSSPAASLRCCM